MLAFSNDYYGLIFRATQSVELFCAYYKSFLILYNLIVIHMYYHQKLVYSMAIMILFQKRKHLHSIPETFYG